jgi:hypothetical protein
MACRLTPIAVAISLFVLPATSNSTNRRSRGPSGAQPDLRTANNCSLLNALPPSATLRMAASSSSYGVVLSR